MNIMRQKVNSDEVKVIIVAKGCYELMSHCEDSCQNKSCQWTVKAMSRHDDRLAAQGLNKLACLPVDRNK
jgi:hypothetical protein